MEMDSAYYSSTHGCHPLPKSILERWICCDFLYFADCSADSTNLMNVKTSAESILSLTWKLLAFRVSKISWNEHCLSDQGPVSFIFETKSGMFQGTDTSPLAGRPTTISKKSMQIHKCPSAVSIFAPKTPEFCPFFPFTSTFANGQSDSAKINNLNAMIPIKNNVVQYHPSVKQSKTVCKLHTKNNLCTMLDEQQELPPMNSPQKTI
jgi:hypothetical protein